MAWWRNGSASDSSPEGCVFNSRPGHLWGYSSVVEHPTADRQVPGSNPGVPFNFIYL